MAIQDFFMLWRDIGLFLYAILKAFLPLPSLEVLLVPLVMTKPQHWLWYSMIGAIGTLLGGAIGYWIAKRLGRKAFERLASSEDITKGEKLMERYGVWAVIIGGITPIPDFLLAYLAGFTNMRFIRFALCDGGARFVRSLLVSYCLIKLGEVIDFDHFGTCFSLIILLWLLVRWLRSRYTCAKAAQSRG